MTPRIAARRILGFETATPVLLQIAALAAAVGTIMSVLYAQVDASSSQGPFAGLFASPITFFVVQFLNTLVSAVLAYRVGKAFGGTGTMNGALALLTGIAVVGTVLQLAQYVLLIVMPPLGFLLALFSLFWMFTALTSFIAELHGFESRTKVLGGIILTVFGLAVLLLLLSMVLGITPLGPV